MSLIPRHACETQYVDSERIDLNAQPRLIYTVGSPTIYDPGNGKPPQIYAKKPDGEGAMIYSSPYNRAVINYYGVMMNDGMPPGYTNRIDTRQVRNY